MFSIYDLKRKEPRVRLRTRVRLEGRNHDDSRFSLDTVTLDVSPHGASVLCEKSIPIGTVLEFIGTSYPFRAHAIVRSVTRDQESGMAVLGLEYPDDERNPLVIGAAVEGDDARKTGPLRPAMGTGRLG